MRDAIMLPAVLDREGVEQLRARLERAHTGAVVTIDGAALERVETPGVQLLCALVLAAEGRGAVVRWVRVSPVLITYVNLLGIGEVIRFDGRAPRRAQRFD